MSTLLEKLEKDTARVRESNPSTLPDWAKKPQEQKSETKREKSKPKKSKKKKK